jgi:hypothetical protein
MAVIKIVPMPGAVGDKGDEGAVGPQGQQGETGLQGPSGADALWSYNGEYNPGAGYAVGDVVTFDGQLWYRKNSNGGNVGDTPSEGLFWDLLAAKGADGEPGLNGLEGEQGPAGADGASAYDIAVENGFVGTEQEWLDSLAVSGSDVDLGNFAFDESTARVFDSNMILEANENDGQVAAQIKINSSDTPIDIAAYQRDDTSFYEGDWSTAEWQSDGGEGGQIVFTGATNIIDFLNTSFNGEFQKITINNEFMYAYSGGSYGGGNGTLYVSTGPEGGTPVTITSLEFIWSTKSGINIDYDDEEMTIDAPGMSIILDSGNDVEIHAEDDIKFYADDNATGYYWRMNSEGEFEIPGGISNETGTDFTIDAADSAIVLNGNNGEYIRNTSSESQIATIGDIANAAPSEASFTVNGGTLGTQPTFDGAPLFSGTYVKTGQLVHFQIQVDMNNILTFGTGQYFIDLPFPAKYGYQFTSGCLHDISSGKQYAIGGHVYAGQLQMALTFTNSAGQDDPFDYNSPVVLSTADNFHISGTYISE